MASRLAGRDLGQQLADQFIRRDIVGPCGVVGDDAMAQHRQGDRPHVLDRDIRPALQKGTRLRGEDQVLPGSRACAPGDVLLARSRGGWRRAARRPGRAGRVSRESFIA